MKIRKIVTSCHRIPDLTGLNLNQPIRCCVQMKYPVKEDKRICYFSTCLCYVYPNVYATKIPFFSYSIVCCNAQEILSFSSTLKVMS